MRYNNILYDLNPVAKIIMMLVLVIPVTFSRDIYYPLLLLLGIMATGWAFSRISPLRLLKSMRMVIVAAFCLCVFLVLTRAVGQTGDIQLGVLGIRYADIEQAVSLALRMLGFAYAALLFTKTTDPVTLVLSLIQCWHVPYQAGYAFLVAYRFVPAFQDEFRKIQIAHEVRGVANSRNIFSGMLRAPGYLVPLLINAIRTGERVAVSMDVRGFGITPERTYCKTVAFGTAEKKAVAACVVTLALFTVIMIATGLFSFSIGFNASAIS